MELDTGWAVLIISFYLYQQNFYRLPVHNTGQSLKTYTGPNMLLEVLKVPVNSQTQRELLDLHLERKNSYV